MKIQSVRIKNFRALKDVTIPFDSVTTFIGPNGAGKSTVLRALDWFFNGKPGSLTEKDCSFGAADEEIEVQVTFSDLSEKDREALGKYAPDGRPRSQHGGNGHLMDPIDSPPTQRVFLHSMQSKQRPVQPQRRTFTRSSGPIVQNLICQPRILALQLMKQ